MELVIRPARMEDVKEIWDLAHANSIVWTDSRIKAELSYIWVMLRDSKMLGVLNGIIAAGQMKLKWVAIHPIYPEKQFRETLINGVCSVLGLDRGEAGIALAKSELVLELG